MNIFLEFYQFSDTPFRVWDPDPFDSFKLFIGRGWAAVLELGGSECDGGLSGDMGTGDSSGVQSVWGSWEQEEQEVVHGGVLPAAASFHLLLVPGLGGQSPAEPDPF